MKMMNTIVFTYMQVFHLFKEIEIVVRSFLNESNINSHILKGSDVHTNILKAATKNPSVLSVWESIASSIAPAYEEYSIELLKLNVDLWVNTRVHAFAELWTMKFQKKYARGTRKSLN